MRLGNDVVDLGEAARPPSARFRQRVFTAHELAYVDRAADSHQALWALWAAKESAFKIVRKWDEYAVFAHSQFVVTAPDVLIDGAVGEITFGMHRFKALWTIASDEAWMHCSAWGPVQLNGHGESNPSSSDAATDSSEAEPGITVHHRVARVLSRPTAYAHSFTERLPGDALSPADLSGTYLSIPPLSSAQLSPAEHASTHSPSSVQVRLLARQLCHETLGIPDLRILRRPRAGGGWSAPAAYRHEDDSEPVAELSLSHDGQFVAAAVLAEPAFAATPSQTRGPTRA